VGLNSSNLLFSKERQTASKRLKPKSKNFTAAVKIEIFERDDYKCVKCNTESNIESVPHHIIFKSQGGYGTKENGCTVCRNCHDWAHGKRLGPNGEPTYKGRKWFEDYRINNFL
jgi:5-methylcytosine-specific restriction endonuclease McrA